MTHVCDRHGVSAVYEFRAHLPVRVGGRYTLRTRTLALRFAIMFADRRSQTCRFVDGDDSSLEAVPAIQIRVPAVCGDSSCLDSDSCGVILAVEKRQRSAGVRDEIWQRVHGDGRGKGVRYKNNNNAGEPVSTRAAPR